MQRPDVGLALRQPRDHLDVDGELRFTLGGSTQDWQYIAFERPALERFVRLAHEVLALREPADRKADRPTAVA
ncbi:hypothetical protein BLA60_28505 [Actinophytocola xinjiangensis]|uniref:Uncharacterized protein n=1 Tax=Actinophytocola xinjiangensis TaxID=485602 RepID=A0A7Z0WKJ0_9PSEU|nr:hypothetical protein [Actinophytocola xinjiangensis]OLF07155.1 hypothetical protein BLA60_28505 [Actinophytocola xinjiangensis]